MGTAASSTNLNHGFPSPGPQNPTGQRVMDHVFFLSNSEWKEVREEANFDFVVIGTGFCCLAFIERALKKDPDCRILVIERGRFFLPEHFQNLPLPFKETLGGLSETFPWTLSSITASGKGGTVQWQHGMVPFFGGRSTLWSAWCPRPTPEEMDGWPQETIKAAQDYFGTAEKLLHVQKADKIDAERCPKTLQLIYGKRPVYGALQRRIQNLLENNENKNLLKNIGIYRTEAAPLASAAEKIDGIDFQKFATPGEILEIVNQSNAQKQNEEEANIKIVSDCVVEKILQQHKRGTALQTSRGVLPLGDAELILAMGTLPPTTLVRNSFPEAPNVGQRFSAHFITSIVARVPKEDLEEPGDEFGSLELGACYVAGIKNNYKQQYHIQLSALWDIDPEKNAGIALRYMPDVVATASPAQLESSEGYVVFVCAVLGELDYDNDQNWFKANDQDDDITTNSLLQIKENSKDEETWNAMDEATFLVLEKVLSPKGVDRLQYWHVDKNDENKGCWKAERPDTKQRRVDATVHESSTLYIGEEKPYLEEEKQDPVDLDYKLRGSKNVYVTGGALWPQGGSWNPTLTMVALAQDLADKLVKKKLNKGNCNCNC